MKSVHITLFLAALLLSACQSGAASSVLNSPASGSNSASEQLTVTEAPTQDPPTAQGALTNLPSPTPDLINTPTPIPASAPLAPGEIIVDRVEQILGTWKGTWGWGTGPGYLIFHQDGSFSVGPSPDGKHALSGKYQIEGQEIQIKDDFCGPDFGSYQLRLTTQPGEQASLRFISLEQDTCVERSARFTNRGEAWDKQP